MNISSDENQSGKHETTTMIADKGDPDLTIKEQSSDPGEREETETSPERDRSASSHGDELPLDVVFGILKNRRRRLVLRYLVNVSETSTLSDLAEHIAAVENDKPLDALTSSERKRVYVCLYQCHLPKMDDAGIVDFENNRGTVELADNTEQLTQYLDTDDTNSERDWPKYYTALAVIGGGAFIAQRLVYPSDALSGIIMGILIGLFANLALEHAYRHDVLKPHRILRRQTRSTAGGD